MIKICYLGEQEEICLVLRANNRWEEYWQAGIDSTLAESS